jgi:hypothetical protein
VALTFDIHKMGWFSFEQLSRTILRTVLKQSVEAYSRGADGGRDGALLGPWTYEGRALAGVLQCKHRSTAESSFTLSDLSDELPKIEALAKQGLCDAYVLMTNAKVSADAAAKITAAVQATGATWCFVYGYETICELLTENRSLRALVPRMYGLGDLSEILDERRYEQAQVILATMRDDLARLVPVKAHQDTYAALLDQRFALLIGRPGSGKTSIAGSLAIGAIDEFGAAPIKLQHIGQFEDHWNPTGHPQFFWVDDVFGANQYDQRASIEWNRIAPMLRAAVEHGTRLICTSRDYVFNAAGPDLRISAFPLLGQAQVIIEVEAFTKDEREQILYNHLKLGKQKASFKKALEPPWLEALAASTHFLPELARRLGDPVFTPSLTYVNEPRLLDFFAKPEQYLLEVLLGLDPASRAGLGLIHLRGGRLPSPIAPTPAELDFLGRVGVAPAAAAAALQDLDQSLVRLVILGSERWWEYHHPTFTDAYRTWLAGEPELLREYVTSTPLGSLLSNTTCGDVGLQGALILPSTMYPIVIDRILAEWPRPSDWESLWQWQRNLWPFLARRCDEGFLRAYVSADPDLMEEPFRIGPWLSAHDHHKRLAKRLVQHGLAPEVFRDEMVAELTRFAVDGIDGSFLQDEDWLWFFTADELEAMDLELWNTTLPSLDQILTDEYASHDDDYDPISEFRDSIAGYQGRFPDHPKVSEALEAIEHMERTPDTSDADYDAWKEDRAISLSEILSSETSIFDDLAE